MVAYRRPLRRQPRRPRRAWSKPAMAAAKQAIQTAGRIYRSYRNRSQLPSRLRVSSTRTPAAIAAAKVLRNVSGSKYQGVTKECLAPVTKPAGNQPISYIFVNASSNVHSLGGSLVNYVPLDLFKFEQGVENDQRIGDYMFLRNTKVKLEIQSLPQRDTTPSQQPVLQFRFLCVKANRKYDKYGAFFDPGNSLYLDTQNKSFGYGIPSGSSTSSTMLNMEAMVNKREWLVYCDKRFSLSSPVINDSANDVNNANAHFKTKKYITLNLPTQKKCHFGSSSNVPENFDGQWLFILQCTNGSYCQEGSSAPRNYAMNIIGSTCAYDM